MESFAGEGGAFLFATRLRGLGVGLDGPHYHTTVATVIRTSYDWHLERGVKAFEWGRRRRCPSRAKFINFQYRSKYYPTVNENERPWAGPVGPSVESRPRQLKHALKTTRVMLFVKF